MRTLSDPHPPGRWFFIPLVRPWCFCSWFGPRSHFLTLYSVWLARRLLLLLLLLMMMLLYYLLIPRLSFPKTFLVFTPFSSTIYTVRACLPALDCLPLCPPPAGLWPRSNLCWHPFEYYHHFNPVGSQRYSFPYNEQRMTWSCPGDEKWCKATTTTRRDKSLVHVPPMSRFIWEWNLHCK